MKIDKDTIKYIANLAMIEINEEEKEKYSKDLEQILTYTEVLNNMNFLEDTTKKVGQYTNYNRYREDKVIEFSDKEGLLKNAKEVENGMFKVPKIL